MVRATLHPVRSTDSPQCPPPGVYKCPCMKQGGIAPDTNGLLKGIQEIKFFKNGSQYERDYVFLDTRIYSPKREGEALSLGSSVSVMVTMSSGQEGKGGLSSRRVQEDGAAGQ